MEISCQLLNPLNFLSRSALVFPDKEALVYGSQSWTYSQLATRVNQLANALRQLGLQKGDRVAFLAPNIPPLLEAHFGVPLAGGVLVAINTRLSSKDISYILNDSGAKFLFIDTEFSHLITPIQEELTTVNTIINIVDSQGNFQDQQIPGLEYESFVNSGSLDAVDSWLEREDDLISLNYTSGTSGQPKGVMYTHRGAYLNALGEALELGLNNRSIYLWTLPMFHCNGWCFTWGVVAVGGTHICLRKFIPATVISLIQDKGVTHFCGSPTILIMLLNEPSIKNLQLNHTLRIATAGAPPSPTLIEGLEQLGMEIIHVYGLTETYGPHSICEWQKPWDDLPMETRARLKARQGVPYIHAVSMRVVNSEMEDVPADGETMGEVVMRGNNVMKGYFNDPEATERAFRGGWFHSGDLAVVHPDGYIDLKDRAKDIIISGGVNISTIEVERAIYRHSAVLEVAVIAIPDLKWGEVPKAFVTLKEGKTVTEEELRQFCRDNLAHFKCPKAFGFTVLPKTSTGKVQKYLLRAQEWQGYEKRIN